MAATSPALERLARLDLRRWGLVVAAVLGVLAVLAAIRYETGSAALRPFDFDEELTVNAAVATLLLWSAAAAAFVSRDARWLGRPAIAVGLALFFLYMGADEIGEIHERLGEWTGLGEAARELPILAAGALLWLLVASRMRAVPPALALFTAGAAAWAVAQGLEKLALSGRVDSFYGPVALAEETLEPIGTALWIAAFVLAARFCPTRTPIGDREGHETAQVERTPARIPIIAVGIEVFS